jgi:hypothetical protein
MKPRGDHNFTESFISLKGNETQNIHKGSKSFIFLSVTVTELLVEETNKYCYLS